MIRLPFSIFLASIMLMGHTCGTRDQNCPANSHNGLSVQNNSTQRILFNFYWNYPDTLLGEYNPSGDATDGIYPGQNFIRGAGPGSCWESVFGDERKEWIYFFNADSLENLDWNVVRKTNRGLLERRLIDLEYLQKNNFIVTYE